MRSGFANRAGGRFAIPYVDAVMLDSPIAYWRHNGLSGSTVGVDSSGNGRNGTYSATGIQGQAGLFLGSGGSANLNGTSHKMSVAHNAALAPTNVLSIESWFTLDDLTQWRVIVSKSQTGGYALDFDGANLRFGVRRNGAYGLAQYAGSNLVAGAIYHVVGTFDGRYVRLHLGTLNSDPVEVAVDDAGATYPIQYSVSNSLYVGAEAGSGTSDTGQFWDGFLDETAMYNSVLSPARILAHNRAARGLAPL